MSRLDHNIEGDLDLSAEDAPLSRNPLFAHLDRHGELLSPEHEAVLARAANRGCQRSRRQLVERNVRLVIKLAEQSSPPSEHDLFDRIQAGVIGLMQAIDRFDPAKGYRLSTYATWWIRQAITRERDKTDLHTGIPADLAREIRTHERIWWNEHGHEPSDAQLATAANLDTEQVTRVRAGMRQHSLDMPINDDGDSTLADLIVDDAANDPADIVEQLDLRQQITEHLRHLDDRSRRLVRLRFGIETGQPETLTHVAARTGMPVAQTRALTARAIRTLQYRMSPPPPHRARDLEWPDRCRQIARQGHDLLAAQQPSCPRTASSTSGAGA